MVVTKLVPKLLSVISEHLGRHHVKSVDCHYVITKSADKVMSISDIITCFLLKKTNSEQSLNSGPSESSWHRNWECGFWTDLQTRVDIPKVL